MYSFTVRKPTSIHLQVCKYILRDSTTAFRNLSALLEKTPFPDVKIRVHTFLADIFFDSSQYGRAISSHLLPALQLSSGLFMEREKSEIGARIAACHFAMGDTEKCWQILEECLPFLVTESDVVTRCAVLKWCCKCRLRVLNDFKDRLSECDRLEQLELVGNMIARMESELSEPLRCGGELGVVWKDVLLLKAVMNV